MSDKKKQRILESEYNCYFNTYLDHFSYPRLDNKCQTILKYVGTEKKVLDIGCLTGYLSFLCMKRGNQVIGIDFIKKALKHAKKLGVDARYCNIEEDEIPVENVKFDVVIISEVIEHLIDPIKVFEKITKVLKPSGILIVSTPNIAYIQYRLEAVLGKLPDYCEFRERYPERPYNFQHKSLFTHKILKKTLEQTGFQVESWKSHSSYKNSFEKLFNPFEKIFPHLFVKNIVAIAHYGPKHN